MINRRSTPSGDGRGRGRSGGHTGRGGRPAFRSDDRRGGGDRDSLRADRGGSRTRPTKPTDRRDDRGGYQGRDDRDRGGYQGRDDRDRGGYQGRDDRDRGGYQGRSDDRGGQGQRRDDRGGFQRRDDRDRGGYQGRSDDRGGQGQRRDDRGGFQRRDDRDRGGYQRRDDRDRGGYQGRDDRGGYQRRDDRDRGGYQGRDDRDRGGFQRRDDRDRGGYQRRDDRDRGGYQGRDDRDRGGFQRRDDRDRGGYQRRDDRDRGGYQGRDDRDRGGYQPRDDRAERSGGDGFRAARGGRRDSAPGPTRARYGKRDDVQTIGGSRTGGKTTGGQSTGRGPRRDERPGRGDKPSDRFKTARQPIRDTAFFEPGYTDERDTTEVPGGVRLQKVLAQAGVASRRACEEMIGAGRVTVNGQIVRRFGAKVDPAEQIIHVDGKRIPTAPDLVYYALNKPIGVVSTMEDPQGRPCLADYVQELAPRLFHVGRLDTETEGLLLLTNDGELANRLTHPSYGVQKKYWAKVPGPIPRDLGRRLREGIELEDGLARADSFSIVQEHGQQALVEVVLHEGRKHIVRRMLEESGHRVIDLARIEFGPVKLGRTKAGTLRALSLAEVGELYAAVKM
ncbi:pseudouridine synthase [Nonomuraea sp. NPDC050394]|uniref:pseudouridine synthase n=1 Tax=Nonomuraea sp. NPDC050394 TaxID=3364363 RepID=UPI0037A448B1